MTPFELWYATFIEPQLPADLPLALREMGKKQAATIWNAAVDQCETLIEENTIDPNKLDDLRARIDMEGIALRNDKSQRHPNVSQARRSR